MALKTFDFKKISVVVNGRNITGFMEGSPIKIQRANDAFELEIGADGEGVRSKSNNLSGSITMTLQQTADSNRILSDLAASDEVSSSGLFAVLIKDAMGSSIFVAEQAWIKKVPDAEYGNKAAGREWVIETDRLVAYVGSN